MHRRKFSILPFFLFLFLVAFNLYFGFQTKEPAQNQTASVFGDTAIIESTPVPDEPTMSKNIFSNPLPSATISSPFGPRDTGNHLGIDLADRDGQSVLSAAAGTVLLADTVTGYGNVIYLEHENGYETRYAHCSTLLVSAGDVIVAGQEIAKVGSTGNSTGPHLHFEILKDGIQEDPAQYIPF